MYRKRIVKIGMFDVPLWGTKVVFLQSCRAVQEVTLGTPAKLTRGTTHPVLAEVAGSSASSSKGFREAGIAEAGRSSNYGRSRPSGVLPCMLWQIADSDEVGHRFRGHVGRPFRLMSAGVAARPRAVGCLRQSGGPGQASTGFAVRFRRRLSPRSWMRWALWTRRSRMASARVGLPIRSCQRSTGTWLVISVAPRP